MNFAENPDISECRRLNLNSYSIYSTVHVVIRQVLIWTLCGADRKFDTFGLMFFTVQIQVKRGSSLIQPQKQRNIGNVHNRIPQVENPQNFQK